MHAHRARATVSDSHELRLRLPPEFPPGEVEVIVLQSNGDAGSSVHRRTERRRLTVDEFLSLRTTPPPGAAAVTLPDIERAIARGALERGIL